LLRNDVDQRHRRNPTPNHPTERNAMSENPHVADELPAPPDLIRAALWDRRTATRQLAERWAERFDTTSTTVDASAAHDDPKDA